MDAFVDLFLKLDETNSTNLKTRHIVDYLRDEDPADAIWAIFFLSGNRFKRLISSRDLRQWARDLYDIPKWLFDEAMVAVGDTGETISLVIDTYRDLHTGEQIQMTLAEWVEKIQDLRHLDPADQKVTVQYWWQHLPRHSIFVLNKLLTGGFRVGVSKQITANAIAEAFELSKSTVLHRMMGNWSPTVEFYKQLTSADESEQAISIPYPFFLASPLDRLPEELGPVDEWYVEWKWDGIRAQLIKRSEEVFVWSRGEELINDSFPELVEQMHHLPDGTVIDGEILAYHQDQPLAFSVLQRRIGRQDVTDAIMSEAPVILMIYDLLEWEGQDTRQLTHTERRGLLQTLVENTYSKFRLSPLVDVSSWQQVEEMRLRSREFQAEGLMLKRKSAPYQVGRKRGDWYKHKVDPLSVDAILIYAQSGSGRRANLFTAYTFAVWTTDQSELIPIGRAYSGLTDEEIRELDSWIRSHTTQRFGPVRSVDPVQVFELGFDGIMTNDRTKSGLSLRFPRMLRWRRDKPAAEADTIETARALLKYEGETEVKLNRSLDEFF